MPHKCISEIKFSTLNLYKTASKNDPLAKDQLLVTKHIHELKIFPSKP